MCIRDRTYLSSILNGKEPNFEEHSNVHFVCDAPTYTMYKIINGTVRELFSTEDVDSCKAMDYIETLCGVLRGWGWLSAERKKLLWKRKFVQLH